MFTDVTGENSMFFTEINMFGNRTEIVLITLYLLKVFKKTNLKLLIEF